ncbi:DNA-directed RNA polymerase subunit beta' [Staphylococcus phage vB_SauM-UFV_DC4]|nr:DNA-directed RNA polymerase subunit beta' [Staphylococcus phage vB_SauM-UFV_DC4]BDE75639.1 hypothetical protein [Staphylococcus phage S6]
MANMNYENKTLNEKEVSTLLSVGKDDITLDKLKELFAFRQNTEPMYNPTDKFTLKKDLVYNKKDEKTTVGRYIFNKFILDNKIGPIIGYMNRDMGGSGVGKLQSDLSNLLLNDIITTQEMSNYIDKLQWLGFSIASFINSSLTTTMMTATEKVKQKKEELLVKYEKALNTPGEELNAISVIEKELINLSKEELKGLADLDIYDSGSRGSFGNNYKLTALIRGANKNFADPSKIRIAKSSLAEGIDPNELYMFGDIMTAGSAGRALGTQEGGYQAKQLMSAFQTTVLDKKGSDCRTNHFLKLILDKSNASLMMYRYFKDNNARSGQLVLLTPENVDDYMGRVLEFRSPMYCASEDICSKCAGELPYKLGIENIGLLVNQVAQAIVTSSMKSFHDMTIKQNEIDIESYIE